jgi:hypothetical protein
MIKINQPVELIAAAVEKTADQPVNSKMCPARYTPKNPKVEEMLITKPGWNRIGYLPGIAPTVFISPKTLPE